MGGVHVYVFSSFETSCCQVVLVKCVAATAVGENDTVFEMNIFASNTMNNFAFKAVFTIVLFHVQSRLNRKYETSESVLMLCFVLSWFPSCVNMNRLYIYMNV